MSLNRISTHMEGESNKPAEKPKKTAEVLPVAYARRGLHFACPSCDHVQFARRSKTHEAKCGHCGKKATVVVKET